MQLWELAAREGVRDTIARYNFHSDAGRWDEVVALFAPDAVFDVDGVLHSGHDAIREVFTGAAARVTAAASEPVDTALVRWQSRGRRPFVRHHTSTLVIDVDAPTRARASCYYLNLAVHGIDHWGRYFDELALIDDRWLFTLRKERIDAAFEGGWVAADRAETDEVTRGLVFPTS